MYVIFCTRCETGQKCMPYFALAVKQVRNVCHLLYSLLSRSVMYAIFPPTIAYAYILYKLMKENVAFFGQVIYYFVVAAWLFTKHG